MNEQLSKEAVDFEAEKPAREIQREIESIEQVSIEQFMNKITQAVTYCDILSQGRSSAENYELARTIEGKTNKITVQEMSNVILESAKWIVLTQEKILDESIKDEFNSILYDTKTIVKEFSNMLVKFVNSWYLHQLSTELENQYNRIYDKSVEIADMGEKSRTIRNELTRKWESLTRKKWDRKNWNLEFPYDSKREPEFRTEYLQDNQ